ncbi:MAG: response regulator [Elusimicrobiota bacterium]
MKNKILLIDNNVNTVAGLTDALEGYGYGAVAVGSPATAAELVQRDFFSVVICNMEMLEDKGVKNIKKIKENSPLSTVIVLPLESDQKTATESKEDSKTKSIINNLLKDNGEPLIIICDKEDKLRPLIEQSIKASEKSARAVVMDLRDKGLKEKVKEIREKNPGTGTFTITRNYLQDTALCSIETGSVSCIVNEVKVRDVIKNLTKAREKIRKENLKNILIIEDDRSLNRTLTGILSKEGYAADSAYTGEDAIKKLSSGFYNAAVVDYKLPDMTGIEVVKKLKEISNINIIFLSGHATLEVAIEAIREEVYDFFRKPVDIPSLLKSFKSLEGHKKGGA